jgi:hypothetical protein
MAVALGETAKAAEVKALKERLVGYFNDDFLHTNNTFDNGVQTTYTLPLHLGIESVAVAKAAGANFLASVKAAKMHMTTGDDPD